MGYVSSGGRLGKRSQPQDERPARHIKSVHLTFSSNDSKLSNFRFYLGLSSIECLRDV